MHTIGQREKLHARDQDSAADANDGASVSLSRFKRGIDRRALLLGAGAGGAMLHLPGLFGGRAVAAPSATTIRIAALRFGSVQWLLETIQANKFDEAERLTLDVRKVASSQAGPIALLSNDADVIVSDWPWAMRQLAKGETMRFAPYSSALGAVMVAPESDLKSLSDLKGKRIGIAGSALDKSFILLRAYTQKTTGQDLLEIATPVFGAPPLLAQEMRSRRIDAVLNFWTYSARLEGAGFKKLIGMDDVMAGLGVKPPPPMVGFVWGTALEKAQPEAVPALLRAVAKANDLLKSSDAAWDPLRDSMRIKDDAEFIALRETYRAGIPKAWTPEHTASAEALLTLLKTLGDTDLIGANTTFDPKLFHGTA
ncbi:MAG: ABC transporter substrate-binding protein [Pseudomonadota bacterium]